MGNLHAKSLSGSSYPHYGGQIQSHQPFDQFEDKQDTHEAIDFNKRMEFLEAKVAKVHVQGHKRTKDDLLASKVEPIFNVKHFVDLVMEAQNIRQELQNLGCFSDVAIHIDTAEQGGPKDYEVTFKVKELSRLGGSVNTMVGNQEGSVILAVKSPNIIGRGELAQCDLSYGWKKTNIFNASFMKPMHNSLNARWTANIYQQIADFPQSGFDELNRGLLFDVNFQVAPHVYQTLQWEGVWRELNSRGSNSTFSVREYAGHTLKSSLKHTLSVDKRDDKEFPTEGTLFKWSQEYAGIGGDVGFFKTELEAQANAKVLQDDITIQGTFNCGLLRQLDNDKTVTIADKFFLGGPFNLRGFDMRGVARQENKCALGGTLFYASGLHLFGPLPFRPGKGGFGDLFRTHLFLNAGNLADLELTRSGVIKDLVESMRFSYGAGIAFRLAGIARIEINYCIPVWSFSGDKPAPGLQFGVGVNFL